MTNTRMIKGLMIMAGYTIPALAKEMGITTKTLSSKLNSEVGKFNQEEIASLIVKLKIKDPMPVFFAHK